jgi:hypothetical protein
MHERACSDICFGEHPNQNNKRFQRDESKRQSEISRNIQTKNNERFQRDEFIAGKAIETSNPKTTSDFNAMNLSRGKQTPISNHSKHSKIKNNKRIQRVPIITSIKTRMKRMNQ